jgi:hypothetical protein
VVTCDRRGCANVPAEDLLYCSDACYEADNDDLMISPVGLNGSGFVEHGRPLTRDRRVPLAIRRVVRTHVFAVDGLDGCAEPGCGLPGANPVHHLPALARRVPVDGAL